MEQNQQEPSFVYNPDTNYDDAIMEQQRKIEQEVADSQALICPKEEFQNLMNEFQNDDIYKQKITALQKRYKFFRRTRGDGNCFYRAFGFAYLERLLNDKTDFKRFYDLMQKSMSELVTLGFPELTVDDFHSTFMSTLDKVGEGCSINDLLSTFNDQCYSDYIVVYLRLLVSGSLQKDAEFYSNFIEGHQTVKEFCAQEVEPMGKESDHIHITTLTSATQVPVRVEYMDRGHSTSTDVNHHDFPEGSTPQIFLLYRPGHYDILYE